MSEINRLVEVMAEMLHEQREMRRELVEFQSEMLELQRGTNTRLERLEHQMMNNNLAIGELRQSVMRLADEILVVHDHERRIVELEKKAA